MEGKKEPLTAAPSALRFLLSLFQLFRPPARARAAESVKLERGWNAECGMQNSTA